MTELVLVKADGKLRGISEKDDRAWKKFKGLVPGLGDGEIVKVSYSLPRNPLFHRKFFAMLNVGFDHWEPARKKKTYKGMPIEKNFDQFRSDVTILAGYYEQTFDLKGRMKLKAKSISFAKMDQEAFEGLYSAVANVLLKMVLTNYSRDDLDQVVEKLLQF
jgi:hypothetical protein